MSARANRGAIGAVVVVFASLSLVSACSAIVGIQDFSPGRDGGTRDGTVVAESGADGSVSESGAGSDSGDGGEDAGCTPACVNQTCVSGKCEGVCAPDQTNPIACGNCGTVTQTCSASGTWEGASCAGLGPCAPGAGQSCNTYGTQTCSSGCWSACSCSAPACVPNATRCSGNGVETCDGCGQWGNAVACLQPTPSCNPGGQTASCVCPVSDAVCTGVCVDEQTDSNNCGGCGIACSGSCLLGRCLVTLASGQANPHFIATDGTSVYWTDDGAGTVMSVPIGGGTATTLASGQSGPQGVVVDGTNAYWGDAQGNGSVMKVALDGGQPTPLASGQAGPTSVAVDGTNVYWTDMGGGTVMKAALSGGGQPSILAGGTGQIPYAIAIDSTNVYFTENDSVQGQGGVVVKVPIVGGGAISLAAGQTLSPFAIAVDATNVYWTNNEASGAVMKVPVDGGAATTLAAGQGGPTGIAVDAANVYWLVSGTVMKTPLVGGALTTLASDQPNATALVVDSTSVYWTNQGTPANGFTDGTVVKLTPK